MNVKELKDWQYILLDTTIILNCLNAQKGSTDEVCKFVLELVKFLSNNKNSKNKDRRFLISAISIAEIWDKSTGDEATTKRVVQLLDTPNTEFISFDEDIAELFKTKYHELLSKRELNRFAREISWPENDLLNGREWVQKDAMILATGESSEADVVLTTDKNTMYPLAKKMDIFCAAAYPRFFNFQGDNFFTYERRKADEEFGFE